MGKRLTTEEFIEKAKKVHGDKYDYSKVDYEDNRANVCIICLKHGEFYQKPYKHLMGRGCPKCGGSAKSSTKEFIEKAKKIHGNKYDYSKVDYKDNNTKVTIICPEHGEFEQKPGNHLMGKGCAQCCGNVKLTTETFIKRANKIHNNKYDYTKTIYVDSLTKVCIICPEHGEFFQNPFSHLNGFGCPKCSGLAKPTLTEFIEKAKEVHGDKYDYSKVIYKNAHTKVTIICPKHGEFKQSPRNHLNRKHGCPKCAIDNSTIYSPEIVYEIAKKYSSRGEFSKKGKGAYDYARKNNLLDQYEWLAPKFEDWDIADNVYAYFFEELNSVYVGRTIDLHKRDLEHRSSKNLDSVFKFSLEHNVDIPEITLLEDKISLSHGGDREVYWMEHYRSIGYQLINKISGGGMGSINSGKWSRPGCFQEAKKYNSIEEFRSKSWYCFRKAKKRDWLKDYTWLNKSDGENGLIPKS